MIVTSYRGGDTSAGIASRAAAKLTSHTESLTHNGEFPAQFGLIFTTPSFAVGRVIVGSLLWAFALKFFFDPRERHLCEMGFETVWFSRKGPKPTADGKGKVISGKGTRECR
jgi:hypothetical protein